MKKFVVIFIIGVILCFNSYAQNTGPVAPEAGAFEPVDVTDVVNLLSGDFTYVIPLMNIPGPAGDFPLSLAYHAGITHDQEASWVGLGWSLNPGAINRKAIGFPDDLNGGQINDLSSMSSTSISENGRINLTVNLKPKGGVGLGSIGLEYSFGDNKAFGGNVKYSLLSSRKIDNLTLLGVSAGFNITGKDIALNGSLNSLNVAEATVSVSTDGSVNGGVGLLGMSYSISSDGDRDGLSFNGIPYNINHTLDDQHQGFYTLKDIFIPINFGLGSLNITYQKLELFVNSLSTSYAYGSLYSNEAYRQDGDIQGNQDKDFLMDVTIDNFKYKELNNTDSYLKYINRENNPMYMAYDAYTVSAQGLGGTMSPRIFQNGLITGHPAEIKRFLDPDDITSEENRVQEEVCFFSFSEDLPKITKTKENIYFYFLNEVSSYLNITNGTFNTPGDTDKDPIWGDYANSGGVIQSDSYQDINSYDSQNQRKRAGKNIEWFTNSQIRQNTAKSLGFIEEDQVYIERRKTITGGEYDNQFFAPDGIGGFMITDVNGVTYHYSIPVYQFAEYTLKSGGYHPDDWYCNENLNMFANSWLLTGITGPDYIDYNNDGKLNNTDFGYWVKFSYGKWSDGYMWQLPYNEEVEKTYNLGIKQIYYLNSVETASHIAYFIKSERLDGKSKNNTTNVSITTSAENAIGPYDIVGYHNCSDPTSIWDENYDENYENNIIISKLHENIIDYNFSMKHTSLKLDRIVLLDKKHNYTFSNNSGSTDLGSIDINYKYYIHYSGINATTLDPDYLEDLISVFGNWDSEGQIYMCKNKSLADYSGMFYNNILDQGDISVNTPLIGLKEIEFEYDYELCPGTPNSDYNNNNEDENDDHGKLTLKSIAINGYNGASVLPPYKFNYYQESPYSFDLDHMDDWGYDIDHPHNWSLKEIFSPTGGKIVVEYEPDQYRKETSVNEQCHFINGESGTVDDINHDYITVTFDIPQKYNFANMVNNAVDYQISGMVEGDDKFYDWLPLFKTWDDAHFSKNSRRFFCKESPSSIDLTNKKITFEIPFPNMVEYFENRYKVHFNANKVISYTLKISTNEDINGGGIRTKRIIVKNSDSDYQVSEYNYDLFETDNTSGIITYSPARPTYFFVPYLSNQPAPFVMYENVEITSKDNSNNTYSHIQYQFKVPQSSNFVASERTYNFEYEMDDILTIQELQPQEEFIGEGNISLEGDHSGFVTRRSTNIMDYSSSIGRLEEVTTRNSFGDILSKTEYDYYDPGELNIGVVGENFQSLKRYMGWSPSHTTSTSAWHFNSTGKIIYPSLVSSVRESNAYGEVITYNNAYDFFTGNTIESMEVNSKTNESIIYKSLPAYVISDYNNMGLKSVANSNKNMLTQQAATITKKNGEPIDASIQTWKGDWDNYLKWNTTSAEPEYDGVDPQSIWRKHKTFVWGGDLAEDGTFGDDFNTFANLNTLKNYWTTYFGGDNYNSWVKSSEVVRYDHFSTPVEVIDVNGNYAAIKKDPDNLRTIASASFSNLTSFAASGFENWNEIAPGFYDVGSYVVVPYNGIYPFGNNDLMDPHTGSYYLRIPTGAIGCKYKANGAELITGQKYRAAVWVNSNSKQYVRLQYKLNGVVQANNQEEVGTYGDWTLIYHDFEVPYGTTSFEVYVESVGGYSGVDDFRVSPYNASIESYVYDNTGNLTFILNNDNFATKYKYDNAGRLINTYIEKPTGFEKIATYEYNYADNDDTEESVEPTISTSTSNISFSNVCAGSTSSWTACTVTNTGTVTASGSITLSGSTSAFLLDANGNGSAETSGTFSLAPGTSKTVYVMFSPLFEGASVTTSLDFNLTDSDNGTSVTITGNVTDCTMSNASMLVEDNGSYNYTFMTNVVTGSGLYLYAWSVEINNLLSLIEDGTLIDGGAGYNITFEEGVTATVYCKITDVRYGNSVTVSKTIKTTGGGGDDPDPEESFDVTLSSTTSSDGCTIVVTAAVALTDLGIKAVNNYEFEWRILKNGFDVVADFTENENICTINYMTETNLTVMCTVCDTSTEECVDATKDISFNCE